MPVNVHIPASLRSLVGGEATLCLDVGDAGATVGGVLDRMALSHVALYRRVCDEQGNVRTHVNVFVGSDNVRDLAGRDTIVPAGVEVTVLPAVSGGSRLI
jgi:molybdopterin synthase sulfur carrier subunit